MSDALNQIKDIDMDQYRVSIKNEILGDSESVMTLKEMANFNKCALLCAEKANQTGKPHTIGMWTVEKIK